MRFMVMAKADKNTEAGALPDEKLLTDMGQRVRFSGAKRTVIEADDFGPALTPELREAEERLRAQAGGKR